MNKKTTSCFKLPLWGSKKAQFEVARKTIYWMIAGFIIAMLIVAYAFITASYRNKLTHLPEELPAEFISLRFINIPECFAYQDPITERVYPGVIDLAKFTEKQMNQCYFTDPDTGHKDFNFKLTLEEKDVSVETNNYFNADQFTLEKKVLVKEGDALNEDNLKILVQARLPGMPIERKESIADQPEAESAEAIPRAG